MVVNKIKSVLFDVEIPSRQYGKSIKSDLILSKKNKSIGYYLHALVYQ